MIRKLHRTMDQRRGVFIMIASLVLMLLSFAFVSNWYGHLGVVRNLSFATIDLFNYSCKNMDPHQGLKVCETASVPIKIIILTLCVPFLYGLWFALIGGKGQVDR